MNKHLEELIDTMVGIESPKEQRAKEFEGLADGKPIVQRIQIAQADITNLNRRFYPKKALLNAFQDFVSNKGEGPIFEEEENPCKNADLDRADINLIGYFDNLDFDEESGKLFCTIHLFKRPPKLYFTISGFGQIDSSGEVGEDYKLAALMNSDTSAWQFQEKELVKKIVKERDSAEETITNLKNIAKKVKLGFMTEQRREVEKNKVKSPKPFSSEVSEKLRKGEERELLDSDICDEAVDDEADNLDEVEILEN